MTQYSRPDGDITRTGVGGGTYADIDEVSPSDSDFIYGAENTAVTFECSLSDPNTPSVDTDHVIRYRVVKLNDTTPDGAGNAVYVTAYLYQGTTLIATDAQRTLTGTWTQYDWAVPSASIANITDYSDLRLRFYSPASGGSASTRRAMGLSWAVLEIPDAVASITGSLSKNLDGVSISAAGELPVNGALDKSVDAVSVSAAGGLSVSGVLSKNLDDVEIVASGQIGAAEPITGSLIKTLGEVGVSCTGYLVVTGSLDESLDNAVLAADGFLPVSGALNQSISNVSISASGSIGDVAVEGVLNKGMDNASLVAAGAVNLSGYMSANLDDASITSTGSVQLLGSVIIGLDDTALISDGYPAIYGVVNKSLAGVMLTATGRINGNLLKQNGLNRVVEIALTKRMEVG